MTEIILPDTYPNNLFLLREQCSKDLPTLGALYFNRKLICYTLELPWKDNKKGISCIPAGVYKCAYVNSPRFGQALKVFDVPNRKYILFHVGNFLKDTHGCILLGSEISPGGDLIGSRRAVKRLLDTLWKIPELTLTIKETLPVSENWKPVDALKVLNSQYH